MEIIKRGKLPENKQAEWTCTHCRSVIRSKQSEGRIESHRNESYVTTICPVCKKSTCVDLGRFQ